MQALLASVDDSITNVTEQLQGFTSCYLHPSCRLATTTRRRGAVVAYIVCKRAIAEHLAPPQGATHSMREPTTHASVRSGHTWRSGQR